MGMPWRVVGLCLALAAGVWGQASAPAPVKLALEEAEAGDDFLVQGEYAGQARDGAGKASAMAAQIVALGNGVFSGALLAGGLPGEGWDGTTRIDLYGRRAQGEVGINSIKPKGWSLRIATDAITGKSDAGATLELKKVRRRSPTLNAAPPPGAIVLFDGTSLEHWAKGRMDERKLLAALSAGDEPVADGPTTKRRFRDVTLHVEFRTPFRPLARGEDRGNSGVQLMGRYEVQVLDSFGRMAGIGECGSFYGLAIPRVNMSLPPLAWQTYDMEFRAPRFDAAGGKVASATATVRHNGVVIHQDVELPQPTTVDKSEPAEGGPLVLQSHENPVYFRNIWVVERAGR